jgi:hypothetical protein
MSNDTDSSSASSRRLFFEVGGEHYQIFTVSQSASDASIYFSAPKFGDIVWLVPAFDAESIPVLLSFQVNDSGKLSLHGSGVAHVKPHGGNDSNSFIVRGNSLKNRDTKTLGMRHLATFFISKPEQRPRSPALARVSDYIFRSSATMHPFVIIFWALPSAGQFNITIGSSFHEDDLEEYPPNCGWGAFNMLSHSIIWFAYRTKHMDRWPENMQACYTDGYTIPLLIGTGTGALRMELREPVYSSSPGSVHIKL